MCSGQSTNRLCSALCVGRAVGHVVDAEARECGDVFLQFGVTALHMACECGHTSTAEWLVSLGADVSAHNKVRSERLAQRVWIVGLRGGPCRG